MSHRPSGSVSPALASSGQAACLRGAWLRFRPASGSCWRAAAPRRPQTAAEPAAAAAQQQPAGPTSSSARSIPTVAAAAAAASLLLAAGPALALDIHMEPANALSLPTWAIHTSSVIEWVTAMGLMWRYGEVSGNPRWKGMAWGMLPCLGSAMCACTFHFFYNSPDLQYLVALQAALTVAGNFTCWWAAYRIYQGAQQQQA